MDKLKNLYEQRKEINNKIFVLEEEKRKKELLELQKAIGKYYVYRNNHYSCPKEEKDYWDMYFYVSGLTDKNRVKGISFEIDSENVIRVELDSIMNIGLDSVEECTKEEFDLKIGGLVHILNNLDEYTR